MAVRVKRSSVPSLAAGGLCGCLHVWDGAPVPGFRGGLASPSPAVFGDGGCLQAMRRFSGFLVCCCCAGCRRLWPLMTEVVRLWNNWEVQGLVLVSFMLQVFLLMLSGMRRRNISIVPRTLLWLAYLLADSTAIYILGHMSFCSRSHEHHQLMAFWAPFLLVHLGGQDTITAYSMEDNHLWPRHLLSLVVQAVGVAYVLYKYVAGSWKMVLAAALVFFTGILKYGERVWALKSSNMDNISNLLDDMKPRVQREGRYCPREQWGEEDKLGSEEILQGAQDLLPICMGQFVDYKFWPSPFQSKAIKLFYDSGHIYKLVEMQLSLMHDVLYTKAAVTHTWCGCFIRAVSLVATMSAFFLFQSSTRGGNFNRIDVIVTYILLAGSLALQMTSVFRAMGSTWTCALLRARRWDRIHSKAVLVRRSVKAAERNTRWSGSIGQHQLLKMYRDVPRVNRGVLLALLFGCGDLWDKLRRSLRSTVISTGTKELVLQEILRMVEACKGKEEIMRSYSGQCTLNSLHGICEDFTSSTGIDFHDKILAWHFATEMFISFSPSWKDRQQDPVVEAIRALSSYMIFLLVERPYMLPIPVRPGLYANAELEFHLDSSSDPMIIIQDIEETYGAPPAFARGAEFGKRLLDKEREIPDVLQVVLGVWVEMLCYAGQHCSRDSHARQLSSGGEFITVVWLITTAMFNRFYCEESWFEDGMKKFFTPPSVYKPGFLVRLFHWCTDLILVCCGIPTTTRKWQSIVKD